jgi:hypothetical protein
VPQAKTSATLQAVQARHHGRRHGWGSARSRELAQGTARCSLWLWLLLSCTPSASAQAREPTVLPIAWHVVEDAAGPVVSAAFLAERLERANAIYAPYGIAFAAVSHDALPERHAALESRADRDALAAASSRGAINCFVVRSLRDVDDPAQMRRGVHWHAPSSHFVILSSIAGLNVLAHELGHFLGNPAHSETAGNLMSYQPGPALPVLDDKQLRRLARAVRGYLARKELRAVKHSPQG